MKTRGTTLTALLLILVAGLALRVAPLEPAHAAPAWYVADDNRPAPGGGPAAIDLLSFTAQVSDDTVTLTWETGTETDNAGFNLYRDRAADGPYATRINGALIPAQGDPVSGASYTFEDTPGYGTFHYKLESVDTGGRTTRYDPVAATVGRQVYLPLVMLDA